MPASDVDLCNQALLLLGQDKIDDFNDDPVGITCNTLYSMLTDTWLSQHPWTFCKKKAQLTATTAPASVWTYAYTLPADRLTAPYAVFQGSDVGGVPVRNYDIQGTTLLTNESTVWVDYIFRPDEAHWPAYFVGFVVMGLAAFLAMPMTQDSSLKNEWMVQAFGPPSDNGMGGALGRAMLVDSQIKPSSVVVESPLVDARF